MRTIIIADNQDITCAGIRYLCGLRFKDAPIRQARNKKDLTLTLGATPDAMIVLDYTLFDIVSVEELLILHERFGAADWIMFSDELRVDFMRQLYLRSSSFSIVLKECMQEEIEAAITASLRSERYVCSRVANAVTHKRYASPETEEQSNLTPVETEILKLIALGRTNIQIAEERFSSVHTITTHRKNIYRKVGVNNAYEATKYALRAGIVDADDYII
ncbi:MAG: response regulator transcription factor [Tannerellaceae bacterium]|jgi:DNA-binding NarL/FixJ family response regulator|nr:response regulator transcription factor [Tannerellaceae bacterium]